MLNLTTVFVKDNSCPDLYHMSALFTKDVLLLSFLGKKLYSLTNSLLLSNELRL